MNSVFLRGTGSAMALLCLLYGLPVFAAACDSCLPAAPAIVPVAAVDDGPSWVFRRSTFTHDPETGARVAQYMRTPPVEPLDDPRAVTSRYRRSRTNVRGIDGSIDTYYEVQAWGNGRGGIDAEWERFHDAWKESYLTGGFYNQSPGVYAPWGYGGHPQGPGGGYGYPGHHPGQGYPGYGFPGQGIPGYGYPGYGGPWKGNGPGNGHPGGGHHGGKDRPHHDD